MHVRTITNAAIFCVFSAFALTGIFSASAENEDHVIGSGRDADRGGGADMPARVLLLAGLLAATNSIRTPAVEKGVHAAHLAQGDVSAFLGEPLCAVHQLYGRKRGGRKVITAQDGTVLAFHGKQVRRSADGGETWGEALEIGPDAEGANALVDETTGAVMLVHPHGHRLVSHDTGLTWKREEIEVRPNLMGHGSSEQKDIFSSAMQPGITLTFGEHKGRLIMPVRWSRGGSIEWRPYIYNTAIYSDDGGKTWQTSAPFPVLGTGEAALAELSDGRILYSSREHMSKGNRFFAWSHDGGGRWLNFWRSEILPDGPRASSYGCLGGLVRLPVEGRDILVYSNVDTDRGVTPPIQKAGASRARGRERMTVWGSFDGGETWPVKRLVHEGPSAYSTLGVGRPDTPSQGRVYLIFEGGKTNAYSSIRVAAFNLGWLLEGEKTGNGTLPKWSRPRRR